MYLFPIRFGLVPRMGLFFASMSEPPVKRAIAFFDGQNLFHSAKTVFGYSFPNYDPLKLAQAVCASRGWTLAEVRFYTGVPEVADNPQWNAFWASKLLTMSRAGVKTTRRPLKYRMKSVRLPDGSTHTFRDADEKGIDVRIAVDVLSFAVQNLLDVAVIFSQDQDLSEVAQELRQIAARENRWIKVASAFPCDPTIPMINPNKPPNRRGINSTDWIEISKVMYDGCIDSINHRPKK
jgi:uncharacterized LabA/DUF88 family protein